MGFLFFFVAIFLSLSPAQFPGTSVLPSLSRDLDLNALDFLFLLRSFFFVFL